MTLTITVPDDLALAVELSAKRSGKSSEKLMIEAIRDRYATSAQAAYGYLKKGKYVAGHESTEDDFLIAEWRGDEIDRG